MTGDFCSDCGGRPYQGFVALTEKLVSLIAPALKMDEIDEKHGSQEQTLSCYVQFSGECDSEIVRAGEGLLEKPAPFLRDLADVPAGYSDYERPRMQDGPEELENLMP